MDAAVVLVDVGSNLGALNRCVLIATDSVVAPLGADLFSLQGLRNLGWTLDRWREDWQRFRIRRVSPTPSLPTGAMRPIGYTVQQCG